MSTNTPASAIARKTLRRVAGPVGHIEERDPRLGLVELDAGDDQVFHALLPAAGSRSSASASGTSFIAAGGRLARRTNAGCGRAWTSSSSKALCTARSAGTAEARSTSTLILISLVVIIWMLIPAAARASNIVVATPVWVRMPRPTTETLATSASWVTPVAPISRAAASAARSVSAQVALGDGEADLGRPVGRHVLDDHVDDDVGRGDRAEERVDDARPVGHAEDRDPGLVLGQRRAGHRRRPAGARRPRRRSRCPVASENELRTWIGTPYFLANSIDRECITPAPRLASSSISS